MAPKRPSPSDQPPPSVTSSEDDVEGTEGEEEEEVVEGVKAEVEESSEEESGDEIDESGSDSGSDSDNEPVKHMIAPRNLDAKPISSKPMVETPKSNKSTSAAAGGAKRALETDSNDKDSKRDRKKKKIDDIEEKGEHIEDSEKKPLFQRVFSEKDEIEILNGLIEFKKRGNRISNNISDGFLEFVKGSLQFEANLSQLNNKVQRLHKKFKKNVERAKPGSDPTISNPHELRSYFLSKEIWGDQILREDNQSGITPGKKSNGKIKSNGVASPTPKKKMLVLPAISPKVETDEEDYSIGRKYLYLDQSLNPQNHMSLPMPPAHLGGHAANHQWDMYGSSKAQAFEQRWKALMFKEAEVYLERVALVQEQTKWMLDLHKSSDS